MTAPAIPATSYQLVALDRPQLEAAHGKMLEWAQGKLDEIDVDLDVERTALQLAVDSKFVTSPFERRIKRLERQRTFYEKIQAAVRLGYAIVPNFPMTIFAIRTDAGRPRGTETDSQWERFRQNARQLPEGEGFYVSPDVDRLQRSETEPDGKGGTKLRYWYSPGEEFKDVAFPVALAKPVLMSRVAAAMAHKLFDQIGVAMDSAQPDARKGDPILLGRILNPRTGRPHFTVFLAWYFDPSSL